jgi:hypothetical protein
VVQHLTEEWVALHATAGATLPERAGASARLQMVVIGKGYDEVAWTLTFVDGRIVATSFGRDDDAADCTFLITAADAAPLAAGELDLHVGFMQGRIKMMGDMGRFMAVLPCTQSEEFRRALAEVAAATELG